ncbi:MAG: hypothetical protein WCP62_17440, partial [Planctomycetota bacterium]
MFSNSVIRSDNIAIFKIRSMESFESRFSQLRGTLMLSRLGLDRLTWFFYANDAKCDTLYCRSGVTGSVNTGFTPKQSFRAFQALLNTVGTRHFIDVLREDSTAYIY